MMKLSIAAALLGAAFACACAGGKNSHPEDIALIPLDRTAPEEVEQYDLSPWVDTSRFAISPLYTGQECLMTGQYERLFVVGDRVYVLDRKVQSVFIFRMDGTFAGKIHSPGNGPMDYIVAYDMFVTDENIVLLDIYSKKVLFYDLGGKYRYAFRMDGWGGNSLFCLGERVYYINEGGEVPAGTYYLFSTDMHGGDLRKELPFEPRRDLKWSDRLAQPYVIGDRGVAYMKFFHNDTIYTVSADRPAAASYVLDWGKYTLPATYREQDLRAFMNDSDVRERYVQKLGKMRWVNGYLAFSYSQGKRGESHTVLYDPKRRQVAVNTKSLTLGQAFGESEAMLQQGGSAGILAAGLCESDVLRALAPDKKGRYAERYRQVADTLSSEANPVLFLYYLNGRL